MSLIMLEYSLQPENNGLNVNKAFCQLLGISQPTLHNFLAGNGQLSQKSWKRVEKETGTVVYQKWLTAIRNGA